MKLFRICASVAVVAAFLTACTMDQNISLKLAEIHPKGYPTELADEEFAKLVEKYTNGTVKIEVFPGGTISGDEKVVVEQVKTGAIHLARVSSGALGNFNPQMNAFGLPYLFDSKEHMWNFLNGAYGQKMLADLAPSGFKGLVWYDGGARSFYSKKPLNGPEDIKGQKFRIIGNPILQKMAQALGASTVSMGAGAVYAAMETNALDGAENNPPSLISFNHYKLAKSYILDEHARLPEVLFINNDVWAKLSANQQAAFVKASAETIAFQRQAWDAYEIQALNTVKEAKVTVIDVPDKSAWKAAVKPVFDAESKAYEETVMAVDAARAKK